MWAEWAINNNFQPLSTLSIPHIDYSSVQHLDSLQYTTTMTVSASSHVAIVTGAGSGFGAGIARKFASSKVAVVVADIVSSMYQESRAQKLTIAG